MTNVIQFDPSDEINYDAFVDEMWIPDFDARIELARCALGVAGEGGEVAEKIKKYLRGDQAIEDVQADIALELGDVLFYVIKLGHLLGYSSIDLLWLNYEKLSKRRDAGTIQGSGDDR